MTVRTFVAGGITAFVLSATAALPQETASDGHTYLDLLAAIEASESLSLGDITADVEIETVTLDTLAEEGAGTEDAFAEARAGYEDNFEEARDAVRASSELATAVEDAGYQIDEILAVWDGRPEAIEIFIEDAPDTEPAE